MLLFNDYLHDPIWETGELINKNKIKKELQLIEDSNRIMNESRE